MTEDIKWTSRSLYPKNGETVDVLAGVDKRTGDAVVRTRATDIEWSSDAPGFSWQSSSDRLADDVRWREKTAIKADQLRNPTKPADELPDLDTALKEGSEYQPRADRGHVTFSGLGGLLGPKGALSRKAD